MACGINGDSSEDLEVGRLLWGIDFLSATGRTGVQS